jgi:hypothetical protein
MLGSLALCEERKTPEERQVADHGNDQALEEVHSPEIAVAQASMGQKAD